jgi:hypothetical protein
MEQLEANDLKHWMVSSSWVRLPANSLPSAIRRRLQFESKRCSDRTFHFVGEAARVAALLRSSGSYSWSYAYEQADLPPPDEAIVARRRRPIALWVSAQGDPVRSRQKMPFKILRSSTRGTPRGLFGNSGSMIDHSKSVSSYRR